MCTLCCLSLTHLHIFPIPIIFTLDLIWCHIVLNSKLCLFQNAFWIQCLNCIGSNLSWACVGSLSSPCVRNDSVYHALSHSTRNICILVNIADTLSGGYILVWKANIKQLIMWWVLTTEYGVWRENPPGGRLGEFLVHHLQAVWSWVYFLIFLGLIFTSS